MIRKFAIIFVLLLAAMIFFKDVVIQCGISKIGSAVLGAPVEVGAFSWNFFSQKIHIRNLKVINPQGFPQQPLIDIPVINVDYDLPAMLKGDLHFPYIEVEIKEMVIVKNAQGVLNVDALKVSQKQSGASASQPAQAMKPFYIDQMKLSLERTVYMDYSRENQPIVKVFNVGFKDKTFKNIKSVQQLSILILTQAMGPAAIKSAAIYGVATFLGASFIPVGVVAALIGRDSVQEEYSADLDRVFKMAVDLLKEEHAYVSDDPARGLIKGNLDGGDLTVVIKVLNGKVHVSTSCRKMMIPRAELASGFMYQLSSRLK